MWYGLGMSRKEQSFLVYRAVNTLNGSSYIGYTSRGLAWRRGAHLQKVRSGDKGCPKFYAAIRKYGEESFTWEVVATFKTAEEALKFEVDLIAIEKPKYNISAGGKGASCPARNRIKVLCLEDGNSFESIIAASIFYNFDRATIQEALAKRGTCGGRHFVRFEQNLSHEDRHVMIRKIEDARVIGRRKTDVVAVTAPISNGTDRLGRSSAGPASLARPVVCLDDGNIFASASEAAFVYKISKSAIIELCLKKNFRRTASGKRFEYLKVN